MADIHYYRILRTHQGGVCGEMTVKSETFFAMENLSDSRYDSIPPGIYRLKMDKLGDREKGQKGPCLRFIEIKGRDGKGYPFLIHRAKKNNWKTLTGCIAPGMEAFHPKGNQLHTGLTDSIKAMDRIMDLLGWFTVGNIRTISIENCAPGQKDIWTREQFIDRRKKHKPT